MTEKLDTTRLEAEVRDLCRRALEFAQDKLPPKPLESMQRGMPIRHDGMDCTFLEWVVRDYDKEWLCKLINADGRIEVVRWSARHPAGETHNQHKGEDNGR